jgi:hypothetical protein
MACQEFDFDIEHVPGVDNIAADGLSRFVKKNEEEDSAGIQINMLCACEANEPLDPSVYERIKQVHNSHRGHHGLQRTLHMLGEEKWANRTANVRQFLAECPICQKQDEKEKRYGAENFTLSTLQPGQLTYVDSIGPLPPSVSEHMDKPYKHILVFVDAFSRYVTLVPLMTVDSSEACQALQDFFSRYRSAQVTSDGGSQFANKVVREFLEMEQVGFSQTLAYSKEENGIVERMNKEVMRHLRAIVYEERVREKWHTKLSTIMRIINTTPCGSTRDTPGSLQFGVYAAAEFPRFTKFVDHGLGVREEELVVLKEEFNSAARRFHEIIIEISAEYQTRHNAVNLAKRSDPDRNSFDIGDMVLILPHRGMGGVRHRKDKLQTLWKGPCEIVAIGGNTHTVRDLNNDKITRHHVRELSKFIQPSHATNMDLEDIAAQDIGEYVVESVVSHDGHSKDRDELYFQIAWQGYESKYDTWEPWINVKGNETVLRYCLLHKELKPLVTAAQKKELNG